MPINKINTNTGKGVIELYAPDYLKVAKNLAVTVKEKLKGDANFDGGDFKNATIELAKKLNVNEPLLRTYIRNHFVWHHVEDLETMVLVPKNVHNYVVKHWGVGAILDQNPTQRIIDLWKASLVYIL